MSYDRERFGPYSLFGCAFISVTSMRICEYTTLFTLGTFYVLLSLTITILNHGKMSWITFKLC